MNRKTPFCSFCSLRGVMVKRIIQMVIAILLCSLPANAEQLKPLPGTFIHDFANVISAGGKSQLQEQAKRLKDEFNTEIAVVTVASLHGEEPFDYSLRMAREWGIGSPDNEVRGILILVAVQERKSSFRTSRHIEGELPDGVTGEINRQMGPFFKNGDFGGGLSQALKLIHERLQEVYAPPQNRQTKTGNRALWLWVLLGCAAVGSLAFLFVWRSGKRARERERKHALTVAETRKNYFAPASSRQTGQKSRQQKLQKKQQKLAKKRQEQEEKQWRESRRRSVHQSGYGSSSSPYESNSSSASTSDSGSANDYGSSSSYDSGSSYDSSSSADSGSSYSGGSDFGGGGSDSSW